MSSIEEETIAAGDGRRPREEEEEEQQPHQGEEPSCSNSSNSKRQRRELNWRMDPGESHSDFTIEIAAVAPEEQADGTDACKTTSSSEDGELTATKTVTYSVHKCVLQFGKRASGYFGALFASGTAETMKNKMRIELNFEPAARAFPIFLDYMYRLDDGESSLTIGNAAPLYHLADYFEVEILRPKIVRFWKKTIAVGDLATCLQQARMYRIDRLGGIVAKRCSKRIADIAVDSSPLLDVSDAKFWLDVFDASEEQDPHLAVVVSEFCFRQKDDLDAKTFDLFRRALIEDFYRSELQADTDAVLKLLSAEKSVMAKASETNREGNVFFQDYLLEALTIDWRRWVDSISLQESLKSISPELFSRAMAISLKFSREEDAALNQLLNHTTTSRSDVLPIMRVAVTGAGIAGANGIYSRCHNFDPKDPMYVKKGLWEGSEATFACELFPTSVGKSRLWNISVEPSGIEEVTHLYESPAFSSGRLALTPRMKSWQGLQEDDNSQPTLFYQFDSIDE